MSDRIGLVVGAPVHVSVHATRELPQTPVDRDVPVIPPEYVLFNLVVHVSLVDARFKLILFHLEVLQDMVEELAIQRAVVIRDQRCV